MSQTMPPAAIRLTTTVLPGRRIEVTAPELVEGEDIEIVLLPRLAPAPVAEQDKMTLLEFINALPPGPRSAASWEEIERGFREERDSWDR